MQKGVVKTQLFKELIKQVKFRNWDDAFRGLTPLMRQQSVRVADYTQVLFRGACKSTAYLNSPDMPEYLDEAYADVAYKCGFFHQLGKALAPEDYPNWRDDFEDDEKSRYCKYAVEGRELVARLQGEYGRETSVSNKMVQDACEFHMERWDGSGFPYGYEGNEISLIAQIVGLAKELDHLICERKSETPYEDAVKLLLEQEEAAFSSDLLDVFRAYQAELKAVYKKYIQYTKTMPKTVPLVEKRPERPFGLKYRQIVSGKDMSEFIFEAVPWFGGVLNQPEAKEYARDVEGLLTRTGMVKDISMYFLYEAADAIARLKNCELNTGGIFVPMFADFFIGEDQKEHLETMYDNSQIDRKKMMLGVPEKLLIEERSVHKRLTDYMEQGIVLVVDDYHPEKLPISFIRELGFSKVRVSKESKASIQELQNQGISVIDWPSGEGMLTEDELINYLLKHEPV